MPLVDYDQPSEVIEPAGQAASVGNLDKSSLNEDDQKTAHYIYPACPQRARRRPPPDLIILYKLQQSEPQSGGDKAFDAGTVYKGRPANHESPPRPKQGRVIATGKHQLEDLRRHAEETADGPQTKKRRGNPRQKRKQEDSSK